VNHLVVVGKNLLEDTTTGRSTPSTKLQAFKELVERQPRDQNSFLTFFIDHRHIPADILTRPRIQQDAFVQAAQIPLSMLEGYLSHSGITPVWDQLEHEPNNLFAAFRVFLNKPGCSLQDVQDSIPQMANVQLEEAYFFYYWRERAKACQLLRPVAASRLRDQRVIAAEDAQFELATHILSQLAGEISQRAKPKPDGTPGRPFEGMSSANLIDAITKMVGVQRDALRIPKTVKTETEDRFRSKELASPETLIADAARQHDGKPADKSASEKLTDDIKQLIAGSEEDAIKIQDAIMGALVTARERKGGGEPTDGSPNNQ
jgi:hypothetical protein